MRVKTKDLLKRLKTYMVDNEYVRAKEIAQAFKLSYGTACRMVRLLREENIGVHVTKKGYVLSEFARKRDDVDYLRRLYGRRSSDFIGLKAAQEYIRRRWNSVEDRATLLRIIGPLSGSARALSGGMKALVQKSETLGI